MAAWAADETGELAACEPGTFATLEIRREGNSCGEMKILLEAR
tara:strand:+ start:463 stop:591 length:129 start_codon:yes stop_codon:yes gene_type:complete